MKAIPLSDTEIANRLNDCPGWVLRDGKLCRELQFSDFVEAFAFMTKMALLAEKMNHHPEWSNVYNKVSIKMVTHSCGGISNLDFEWAKSANNILSK